jgi:hypothetical protein
MIIEIPIGYDLIRAFFEVVDSWFPMIRGCGRTNENGAMPCANSPDIDCNSGGRKGNSQ